MLGFRAKAFRFALNKKFRKAEALYNVENIRWWSLSLLLKEIKKKQKKNKM